jgi:6-phosphogluconolactonase
VAVHPTRNFVYVTNAFVFSSPATSSLSAFRFDATTGVLTPIAGTPFSANGGSATAAQIDPSGKFLYVSNQVSSNIQAYAIDQTTGVLTNVPGSPFAVGEFPFPIQIDASGKYLYVAAFTSRTVASYAIDAMTGALTLVSSVQTGAGPSSVELVGLQ